MVASLKKGDLQIYAKGCCFNDKFLPHAFEVPCDQTTVCKDLFITSMHDWAFMQVQNLKAALAAAHSTDARGSADIDHGSGGDTPQQPCGSADTAQQQEEEPRERGGWMEKCSEIVAAMWLRDWELMQDLAEAYVGNITSVNAVKKAEHRQRKAFALR